jgi:hypothetical protein
MDHDEGIRLGEGWVAEWNRRDLDADGLVVRGAGTYGEPPGVPF